MYPLRRDFLKWITAFSSLQSVKAQSFDSWSSSQSNPGRLVLVLLRGAYDGLSAFYPYADVNYRKFRPNIGLGVSLESESQAQYKLDEDFALHPALSPLIPFWESKQFAFIPTAGLSKAYRSHFEAQHYLEIGQDGINTARNGWLNELLGQIRDAGLIGVGEANPEILRGKMHAQLVPRGNAALQTGVLADFHHREVLEALYQNDSSLSELFKAGEISRLSTAQMLNQSRLSASKDDMLINKDASAPSALLQDCRHLVAMMNQNPSLKLGFLSTGGWDTHAGQGNEKGTLANNFLNLAQSLAFLQNHLNQPNDVVVVVSEFGRTVHENASRGTDHGYGNAMMIMGPLINGGQRLGRWEGLDLDRLNDFRDLPVFHDYRWILSQIIERLFGLTMNQMIKIFPDISKVKIQSSNDLMLFKS